MQNKTDLKRSGFFEVLMILASGKPGGSWTDKLCLLNYSVRTPKLTGFIALSFSDKGAKLRLKTSAKSI
jgi:hypothetical protein